MARTDTYHHGDLSNALLDAVAAIIAENGVGAVSLREAARRANVSHSAPAHHFGDKRGMLTAFATRGFERFRQRMQTAFDRAGGGRPGFNAIGIEYIQFALEEQAYFEVMFRTEFHDEADPTFQEASHAAFGVLIDAVRDIDPSEFGGADPTLVAFASWSTVHGLASLWLDGAISHFTDDNILNVAMNVFAIQEHFLSSREE